MEKVKRNLQESIVLQNSLISILHKMIKTADKPLFKFVRERTRENVSTASELICKEVSINLLKELFTLINQIWANRPNRFDESLSNEKAMFSVIKSKISTDGKTLPFNNKELYKRIRESIVHNNKINPNFVYNLSNFELNLGMKTSVKYLFASSIVVILFNLNSLVNLS